MEPKVDLHKTNAADYLASRGMKLEGAQISELGGGVSNTVLLVESDAARFVLKQALGKLRGWNRNGFRIAIASSANPAALRRLAPLLPAGSLPAGIV